MPKKETNKTWNKVLIIVILLAVVIFAFVILNMKNSLRLVTQDNSVISLTGDTAFNIVRLMNMNKNLLGDECWNQTDPYGECGEENKITPGNYHIQSDNGNFRLTPIDNEAYTLTDDEVRQALKGFMITERTYFQTVKVEYRSNGDQMDVTVLTKNDLGDSNSQQLTFYKP